MKYFYYIPLNRCEMDEYVSVVSGRLLGRIPVKKLTVGEDNDTIIDLLTYSCRRDFRYYYFNESIITFENMDYVIMIAVMLLPKSMFADFMRTKWCERYDSIRFCHGKASTWNIVYVMKFGDFVCYYDKNIPVDFKLLIEKGFTMLGEIYCYEIK